MGPPLFFLGLILVAACNAGSGLLPSGGQSAKSALPNILLAAVVWLSGEHARWAGTVFGVGFMCAGLLLGIRRTRKK